jgi:C1A family cysteine protease
MSHVRGYGRVPDLPDQRDHQFAQVPKPRAVVPPSLDLRSKNYGIDDQGQLGSCVGHGTEGAFRNLLAHEGVADFVGSRLGVYYCARVLEHDTAQDAGAQIRDGVKAAANTGVMPEALWPYVESKFAEKPPAAAYAAATAHKAVEYLRVDNTDWNQIKSAIATYGNLIIGITAYDSFESEHTAKTGQMTMPKKSEKVVGGHCMRALGYTSTHLIVANSWAASWGDKGFCYMPKAYCTNSQLSSDWWVLRRA